MESRERKRKKERRVMEDGLEQSGGKKKGKLENAFCTAGVQAPSQMSQEHPLDAQAQIHSAEGLRMVGGSVYVCSRFKL